MKRTFPAGSILAAMILLNGMGAPAATGDLPGVKVTAVRRVFHNGEHNAFTDLVRFQGRFYLTFRFFYIAALGDRREGMGKNEAEEALLLGVTNQFHGRYGTAFTA